MTSALLLIPARLAASRLPNKPLADLHGEAMIVHVWRRAKAAKIGEVAVATDAPEIADVIRASGGIALMTASHHQSGSDRIFEALRSFDPQGKFETIINVQGDLPTLEPQLIQQTLVPFEDRTVDITTLVAEICRQEECINPNVVKCIGSPVSTNRLRALYFTRAAAPWGEGPFYHHIGLYGYRRAALERFVALPPSPLERREKLEQLRALEAQMRIDAMIVDTVPLGVDTPEDLVRARELLAASHTKAQ